MPKRVAPTTDLPGAQIRAKMEAAIQANPGVKLYVKWTCPKCRERVTADDANTFHMGGYKCECGHLYTGDLFGLMAVFVTPKARASAKA